MRSTLIARTEGRRLITPCTTPGRPLVRVWPAGSERPVRWRRRIHGLPTPTQKPCRCGLFRDQPTNSAPCGLHREEKHEQLGGDFDIAQVLFVAVRRRHTEREGLRHARNVAAE